MTICLVWASLLLPWKSWLPIPAENYFFYAVRCYQEGRFAESEAAFEMAEKTGPTDAAARFNAGNAAFQQGKYPEAVLYFEKVLAARPGDEDAWANLQLARRRTGRATPGNAVPDPSGRPGRAASTVHAGASDEPAAAEVFNLPPEDLVNFLREQTRSGYPFRPGMSLKKTRKAPEEMDW